MPIYEYRCKSCEDTFEIIQRFADRPLRKCRKCSGRLEKLISRTAFQLKGGGWYAEGYSKGREKPSADSKPKEGSSDSVKGGSKSETKAAAAGKKD